MPLADRLMKCGFAKSLPTDQPMKLILKRKRIRVTAAGCVDLCAIAGKRYRYAHDQRNDLRSDDPWLIIISCKYGHIYVHGRDKIGYASARRGGIAHAVAALPGAIIEQDSDDGQNISVPARLFQRVANIAKARRRRQMSPEQAATATARLEAYRRKLLRNAVAKPFPPRKPR
jgi:hypothetical protein